MRLSELFHQCLTVRYTHVEQGGDVAFRPLGHTLYIYLECSDGAEDWRHNLDFPATAYRRPNGEIWYAHRGFLRVWQAVEPYVAEAVSAPTVQRVITVGYSHGAALAALCHESIWHSRPDLRHHMEGWGFGCPRTVWGPISKRVLVRWENFTVVRNLDDVVTHLPPAWLGYRHVGTMMTVGQRGAYTPVDAHRPESILRELRRYEAEHGVSGSAANTKKQGRAATCDKAGQPNDVCPCGQVMSAPPCDVAFGNDAVPSAQWANITSLRPSGATSL